MKANFAQVPNFLLRSRLPSADLKVFLFYLSHNHSQGVRKFSIQTIHEYLGLSHNTIKDSLKRLVHAGMLKVEGARIRRQPTSYVPTAPSEWRITSKKNYNSRLSFEALVKIEKGKVARDKTNQKDADHRKQGINKAA